jgi:alcohol dehydrogenase
MLTEASRVLSEGIVREAGGRGGPPWYSLRTNIALGSLLASHSASVIATLLDFSVSYQRSACSPSHRDHRMDTVILQQPGRLVRADTPLPPPPGPGEALVRVHRVGVCGTDLHAFRGRQAFFSYPRILGHELGVEVLAVGPGVSHLSPGDRCAVEPYINCGACLACRRGKPNCCASLQVLGVHTDGGLRERIVVPARKLHVSAKLSLEQLALVETLAIGCHAVARAAVRPDETCLVLGAGPIGLAVLEFVRQAGAPVVVVDVNAQRLDFCRRVLGVENTLPSADALAGELPEVVFDCTGASASMSGAFHKVAPGGRLVFVGITTDEVVFRHHLFHKVEGTLLCSRNALPGDFTRIIGLIEDGRLDTRPWITHRTPFADLVDVFPSFTRPETGVVKAVVEL